MDNRELTEQRRRRLFGKIILTVAALGSVAGLTVATTYASWTASATQTNDQMGSSTVALNLGATGASTNRLNINASGLAPGDTIQRSVDLTNPSGDLDYASITLTTTATSSSQLDTDATNGLQMQIDVCPAGWTEAGSSPAFTYTCGASSAVLATGRVIQTNAALTNLASVTNNHTDHLRITLTLPAAAASSEQGQSSTITYSFTGTQRVASAH